MTTTDLIDKINAQAKEIDILRDRIEYLCEILDAAYDADPYIFGNSKDWHK